MLSGRYLAERVAAGLIPPLTGLHQKPVYLFSGTDDVYVYQSVMKGESRGQTSSMSQ